MLRAQQLLCPRVPLLPRCLGRPRPPARLQSCMAVCLPPPPAGGSRLAVIGDVHGDYGARDEGAFSALQADIVCIVGDIGEEDLELVQLMSQISLPKAVILGNHDGWQHRKSNFRKDYIKYHNGADPDEAAIRKFYKGVVAQLDAFGTDHVGYGAKHFQAQSISVVGARPCSWGGERWRLGAGICEDLFDVKSMAESAARIQHHICTQPPGSTVVVMGHNGPTGLGSSRHDICGVDWLPEQGDNGDPDLRAALDAAHQQEVHVPLVLFGHMHHQLSRRHRGKESLRNMVHIDPSTGTVCLNAVVVPRWRDTEKHHLSHFTIADLSKDGAVTYAANVWVKTEEKDPNQGFRKCPAEVVDVEELLQQLPAAQDCIIRRLRLAHNEDRKEDPLVRSGVPGSKGLPEA